MGQKDYTTFGLNLRAITLMVLLCVSALSWADGSFTITFHERLGSSNHWQADEYDDDDCENYAISAATAMAYLDGGTEYVAAFDSMQYCYQGLHGIRIFNKEWVWDRYGNGGYFTIRLKSPIVITSIVFTYAQPTYLTGNTIAVSINGHSTEASIQATNELRWRTRAQGATIPQLYRWAEYRTTTASYSGNEQFTSAIKVYQERSASKLVGEGTYIRSMQINYRDINYTVTTNKNGWATFYAREATTIPSGCQVYYVNSYDEDDPSGSNSLNMVEITSRGIVPAGTGVIVKNSENTTNADAGEELQTKAFTFTVTPTAGTAISGNKLTGTQNQITNPKPNGNVYVMNTKNGTTRFFRLSSTGTIKANRAYFDFSTSPFEEEEGGESKSIRFSFQNPVVGISTISNDKKINNDNIYDLNGRIVNIDGNLPAGIYIKNGKKFLVK